ncbi:MAG: hypothetical protein JNL70_18650 [Saprospiraceae bacterium]|nr:hypothetical protein [Saprospiraceae bacterium]
MKTVKNLSIVASLFLWFQVTGLQAQNPDQVNLGTFNMNEENVEIEKKAPRIQAAAGPSIRTFKDQNTGKVYGPNDLIQIPDGKAIPASQYFSEIEKLERDFNTKGYSIVNDPAENIVGKPKVSEAELVRQRSSQAAAGRFFNDQEIDRVFKSSNIFNGKELKSVGEMTDADFNGMKANRINIATKPSSGELEGTILAVGAAGVMAQAAAPAPGTLLKTISKTATKTWSFGSASSFKAAITGTLAINGKLYQPAGSLSQLTLAQARAELAKTNSELNFTANGRIDGTLFNKNFNVLNITGNAKVPANSAQQITIGLSVVAAGSNIFNFSQGFPQSFSLISEKSAYKEIRYSYSTVIVVVPVTGAVGVKGRVGLRYGISGDKQSLRAGVTPFAELGGFAEAYINLLVVKAGVRGSIVFVNGSVPLTGDLLLTLNNGLVLTEKLYAGYSLNFLAGKLELFAKVWTFWKGWKEYTHTLWSTSGFTVSGSFINYQNAQVFSW